MVGWTTDPINPLLTGKAAENPRKSRLVVLGHGGIFTGNKLSPANESLLLNAINWQLKRTDRIPHEDVEKVWSYPRVSLNEQQTLGWHWGAFLGLPLLAVYFGLIVLLYRGLR
jgi:hypothetical protein